MKPILWLPFLAARQPLQQQSFITTAHLCPPYYHSIIPCCCCWRSRCFLPPLCCHQKHHWVDPFKFNKCGKRR